MMIDNNNHTQFTNKPAELLPLRLCVGALIFNQSNKVWIGKRMGAVELSQSTKLWQLPQGGIDKGENPLQAAYREVYEETGIKAIRCIGEMPQWLDYELPASLIGKALRGLYRGQSQKWFAFRYEGNNNDINIEHPIDGNPQEFSDWRWEDLSILPELVVDFKRPIYQKLVEHFASVKKI